MSCSIRKLGNPRYSQRQLRTRGQKYNTTVIRLPVLESSISSYTKRSNVPSIRIFQLKRLKFKSQQRSDQRQILRKSFPRDFNASRNRRNFGISHVPLDLYFGLIHTTSENFKPRANFQLEITIFFILTHLTVHHCKR